MKNIQMNLLHSPRVIAGYIIGPVAFLYLVIFADLDPGKPAVTYTLAVGLLIVFTYFTAGAIFGVSDLSLPIWAAHL